MDYAEFAPQARLAPYVHCIWTYVSTAPGEAPERIVPDGRPELIVHVGEPFAEVDRRGLEHDQPRALFAGQVTRPLHLRGRGAAGVIGVRFKPAGARPFLGQSLRSATDLRVNIDTLWPGAGAMFANDMMNKATLPERVNLAQDFVAARIAAHENERDKLVESCVARIEATRGAVDLVDMIEDSGVGRRQLERRFGDAVGVGPSLLASIFRFRGVFDVIRHDTGRPWTDAALAAGYYDQSHFIREFRRFVGVSPTEFLREAAGLAEALAQPQRDVAKVQAK